MDDREDSTTRVTVYWRPGCVYCMALRRRLRKTGIPHSRIDIWADEDAAGFVMAATGGDQTVPTVRIDDTVLVNPSIHEVVDVVLRDCPEILPEGFEPPRPGMIGRLLGRLIGT